MAEGDEETSSCPRCDGKAFKACCTTWSIYWRAFVLLWVVVVYLGFGGLFFVLAERPNEVDAIDRAKKEREEARVAIRTSLLDLANCTSEDGACTERVEELIVDLSDLFDDLKELPAENNPLWEYGPAVFFATSVITTIGYGNLAPVTSTGQVLFIFYAIFGIPIALLFLSTLGEILSKFLDFLLAPFFKRYKDHTVWVRTIGLFVAIFVGLVVFIFIPALIYWEIETWTYGESVYFCFVTLMTVGFGDFVPAQDEENSFVTHLRGLYKICSSFWVWTGLAFVALVITEIQKIFERTGRKLRTLRLGKVIVGKLTARVQGQVDQVDLTEMSPTKEQSPQDTQEEY